MRVECSYPLLMRRATTEHAGESGVQLSIAYGPATTEHASEMECSYPLLMRRATMEHAGESAVQLSIAYETGHHGACW